MKEPVYAHKTLRTKNSECKCGNLLPYRISPFMTEEKRVCPKCGKVYWVDDSPIDWKRNVLR